ncbi:MAG TPA: response regulator [Planctomycetaceae bacterium]|nr:response regulator [Planctomycetaceae bacterium]
MTSDTVSIMIVDDDEVDVRAIQRGLKQQRIANPVYIATDGRQGLEMLRGEQGYSKIPQPALIVLDLNMPRMTGLEFLEALRADAELVNSIVFILTSSDADEDKAAAYKHHIAGYVVKADAGVSFLKAVQMVQKYVLCVRFPPEHG